MENNHMNAVNYIIQAIKDGSNLPSEHYEYEIACIMVDYASQTAPKLVLPNRDTSNSNSDIWIESKRSWNACIDEIIRLNPHLTESE